MTYELNIRYSGNTAENDTDAIDRMLAVFTAHDETRAFNTESDDSIAAEAGMVTDRDSDALWILQNAECSEDNPECDFGPEPISGYDGEINDRYEMVCHTH